MDIVKIVDNVSVSRRGIFRGVAVIAGGGLLASAGLASTSARAAQAKRPQRTVAYQDTPKGHARCDNCTQWQAPASCTRVEGPIKAAGWCNIYAPKG